MKRRRRTKRGGWRKLALALAAIPGLYLLAAFIGSLVPVNRGWVEPDHGITIYIADNGVHADLIMPVSSAGLDWAPLVPRQDMTAPPPGARWIAFGSGERHVYLDTPTWADLTLRTALRGLVGGDRVLHVEWVGNPAYAARAIRLRPKEYRQLWAAIRVEFRRDDESGAPILIDHPGYGPSDRFYVGIGKASAIDTCNQWVASRLRLAGVKAPLWSPFVEGLVWRYREADDRDRRR